MADGNILKQCIRGILQLGGRTSYQSLCQHLVHGADEGLNQENIKDTLLTYEYEWFVIVRQPNNDQGELSPVSDVAVVTSLKLCENYLSNQCAAANCTDLHLCLDFVLTNHNNPGCPKSHSFNDQHNSPTLQVHQKQLDSWDFLIEDPGQLMKTLLTCNRTERIRRRFLIREQTIHVINTNTAANANFNGELQQVLNMTQAFINSLPDMEWEPNWDLGPAELQPLR